MRPGEAIEIHHYRIYVVQQPKERQTYAKIKKNHLVLEENCVSGQKHKLFNKTINTFRYNFFHPAHFADYAQVDLSIMY